MNILLVALGRGRMSTEGKRYEEGWDGRAVAEGKMMMEEGTG